MNAAVTSDRRQHLLPAPVTLESGVVLPRVSVAYHTWGTLAPGGDNAVLVCHALTGSSDVSDWWGGLIGPHGALDPSRDYVVCSNVLGSCYGSTGPGTPEWDAVFGRQPEAPAVTIRDVVHVQRQLLEALGVRRLRLVIGGSMGGMQALEWALLYPGMVEAIAVLAAPAVHAPWAMALAEVQRQAIFADPEWPHGRAAKGLAAARMMGMISYRSAQAFEARFGAGRHDASAPSVTRWLHRHGEKLVDRFDARAYVTLTHVLDSHDVGRGRGGVQAALARLHQPALVVGIDSDVLYLPDEMRGLARDLPAGELFWLESPHGHDAFLIEQDVVLRAVRDFRAQLEM
ncbi:homoserine O-acetyltransferase [Luteitalea sp. TBR-22]|uniref:homoserine O-acetyltransferase MetX n=1 Tax=Luteitalea sp. TBR-22 TaxID=2802971 RepID=UPI001AFB931A|nr:homoserine O-acetyltransferase [Luteitalea sp. TBR-22]BCS32800.1 homoserine O-acetyltransferase [Luteitalea sp. TBR-22]